MKNILVYYLYSLDNAGDMAICLGALDSLTKLKDVKITMVSRYTKNDPKFKESKMFIEKYHSSVIVKPGYIPFKRSGNFFSKLFSYIYGGFLSTFPLLCKRMRKDVDEADLVLFNGGNYLRCNSFSDSSRLRALFMPIKVAKKMKKKIICLPQSSNYTSSKKNKIKLKKYCDCFDFVFLRENKSMSFLVEQRIVKKENCLCLCDLAFFLDDRFDHSEECNNAGGVAINMRMTGIGDIGYISQEKQMMIKETYRQLIIDYPSINFCFVCQTKKDFLPMKELFDELSEQGINNIAFKYSSDAYELKSIYKQKSLLISMRLHASILSISSETNVLGFTFSEWGFKNVGILNQFGMTNCENGQDLLDYFSKYELNKKKNDSPVILIQSYKKSLLEVINRYLDE